MDPVKRGTEASKEKASMYRHSPGTPQLLTPSLRDRLTCTWVEFSRKEQRRFHSGMGAAATVAS